MDDKPSSSFGILDVHSRGSASPSVRPSCAFFFSFMPLLPVTTFSLRFVVPLPFLKFLSPSREYGGTSFAVRRAPLSLITGSGRGKAPSCIHRGNYPCVVCDMRGKGSVAQALGANVVSFPLQSSPVIPARIPPAHSHLLDPCNRPATNNPFADP